MPNATSSTISQQRNNIDQALKQYHSRISKNASHGFTLDAIKNAWFGPLQDELSALEAEEHRNLEEIGYILNKMNAIVTEKIT